MKVSDEEYQKHAVFTDLERCIAFYASLAHSVFGFVSVGTRASCNIHSYVFSSIQGTLASIHAILRDGRINDAYALLRKYYDSAIIDIYTDLYLNDHFSIKDSIVAQIDRWLQGKERLPEFRIMFRYIRNSPRVAQITRLLFAGDQYKLLRDRCNDHIHYNFYRNLLLNDREIFLKERRQALEDFSNDLRDVLILHLSCMFLVRDYYLMSSDYLDCLECGMTPEPDSQHWVAPFVQEMFDQTIKKSRPDVAIVVQMHTSMHLA